jgi:HAD superfamily phosphatase (TIGR01681 family)
MIYLFDLDITLWDTYDKYGNQIWAKQMIRPFTLNGDVITDDVFSTCTLRKGVREYLFYLHSEGHELGFISVGAAKHIAYEKQPSYFLMHNFNIYKYFKNTKVLKHKFYNKVETIEKLKGKIVFYDDSSKNLEAVKHLDNVIAVNSFDIHDWSTLIGKKYD